MTTTTDRFGMTVLPTNQCLELLRSNVVGRLAVSITNHPDIFPVNYVVDHGCIVFRTAEGTKLAAAVLGRGVAFEVDGYDADGGEAWSVVVKGHAVEIERMQEVFDAARPAAVPMAGRTEAPLRAHRAGRHLRPPLPASSKGPGRAPPTVVVSETTLTAPRRSDDRTMGDWERLLCGEPTVDEFDPTETNGLPEPVRRYFLAAIAAGTPLATSARLRMRGHIKVGRWLPFRARQVAQPARGVHLDRPCCRRDRRRRPLPRRRRRDALEARRPRRRRQR